MATITSIVADGDPISTFFVAGFANADQACQFVKQDFKLQQLEPTLRKQDVRPGTVVSFTDYPVIVCWYNNGSEGATLLMMFQAYGDLGPMQFGSWGAQLLLARAPA